MTDWFISLTIFFAVFTQSLSGFGLGLIAMSILVKIIDLKIASPLVSLTAFTTLIFLNIYHKSEFNFKSVLPLIIGSVLTIPLGIFVVRKFDNQLIVIVLAIVIISYSLYSILNFPTPNIASPKLGYVFGLVSGILSGAYNTGGPPAVIYGNCCRWQPKTFKSNLSGFFLVNTSMVNLNHFTQGNLNLQVFFLFLKNLPYLFLGLSIGLYLSQFVNNNYFRKLVLILLLFTGVNLLI